MLVTLERVRASDGVSERLGPVDTDRIDPTLGEAIERKIKEIDFFTIDRVLPPDHEGQIPDHRVVVQDGDGIHGVGYVPGSEAAVRFGVQDLADLVESTGLPFREVHFDSAGHEIPQIDWTTWSAWYNREPGADDPELHVTGEGTAPRSGATLTLTPGNVGVAPQPDLLALDLTVAFPDVSNEVITPVTVRFDGDVGPDIATVRIQGDASAEIEVTIAE